MLLTESPASLQLHVGTRLGVSDWILVDQEMIDRFAMATGDDQWIHVDTERAKHELPKGKTIAHGYLLFALIPRLMKQVLHIERRSRAVNYGSNKIRFIAPVLCGSRVRLDVTLKASEVAASGYSCIFDNTLELERSARPALVAETISIYYE